MICAAADQFRRIAPRFDPFPHDRGFLNYSLVSRSAKLFVDDPAAPAALVLTGGWEGFVFVTGDATKAPLVVELLKTLARGSEWPLIISAADLRWRESLLASIRPPVWRVPRVDYRCDPNHFHGTQSLIEGFDIAPLNEALASRLRNECDPDFDEKCFADHGGIGFVVLYRDRIVSSAWAPTTAGIAEIAVSTVEEHRNKGLSQAATSALVAECARRSLQPHYATNQQNLAARKLTERLGFVEYALHEWIVLKRTCTT